jgi:hypothetical protein
MCIDYQQSSEKWKQQKEGLVMLKIESAMFKDKKAIIVIEYIIGFSLLILVLPYIVAKQPGWDSAHWWAYLLFILGAGIALIGSASGMKQRMELGQRIIKLERKIDILIKQAQIECEQKNKACESLVGSY